MQVSKASDFVAEWQQQVLDQILAVTMYLELSRLPHNTTSDSLTGAIFGQWYSWSKFLLLYLNCRKRTYQYLSIGNSQTESFCLSMRYMWTVLNTCRLQTSPLFPSHKSLYHQRSAPCYSLWRTGTNEEPGWAGGPGADRNAAWRSRRRLTTKQNAS